MITINLKKSKKMGPAWAALAALSLTLFVPVAGAAEIDCPGVKGTPSTLVKEGYLTLAFFALDRQVRGKSAPADKAAAIACIDRVQEKNGLVDLPNYDSQVARLSGQAEFRSQVARFAFRSILQRTAAVPAKKLARANATLVSAVKGSKYEAAAQGWMTAMVASQTGAARAALTKASSELADETAALRASLGLALARAHYASGNDAAAIAEYEKLFKIGAPMQDALIESAWAHLRSKNYAKSLGLSVELSTGKLSQFFAPEALAIRAIGFVENCRYAESRGAISSFASTYKPVANWLKKEAPASLYETAVARAEGEIGEEAVPSLVWSVWSSSDLFVSLQSGIQKSFVEELEAAEWLVEDEGLKGAALANANADLKKIPGMRARAASRIEKHLASLNASMVSRIDRESERMRFVRVEANQGAGRDIVYRNANPELAKVEKKLKKQDRKAKSYQGKLAWGDAQAEDPKAELWIDEIGNFEAKALDRCKAKAEYKKLQASR